MDISSPGITGPGSLSPKGKPHDVDTSVSHHQFRTVKVTDPAMIATLKQMAEEQADTDLNPSDTAFVAKSHDERVITSTKATHSLKAVPDLRTQAFDQDVDIEVDESVVEDPESDTQSEIDEFDETEEAGLTSPTPKNVDDADEAAEQRSVKGWFAQKAKSIGKSIRDWVIRVPDRVMNRLPLKASNAIALHAPSPKALKERLTGKVADPSTHMQDLSKQASQHLNELSKPGGLSAYAEDDQLTAVTQNISETQTALDALYREREALIDHFDAKGAVQDLDEMNDRIAALSSELKSYELAEKMLLEMMKPAATETRKEMVTKERDDYKSKLEAFKLQSQELDAKLDSLSKEYAGLKSLQKEPVRKKQNDIKRLNAEVKALEKKISQIDQHVESPDKKIIHLDGDGAVDYDDMQEAIENKKQEVRDLNSSLDKINENIAIKKQTLSDVEVQQAKLRQKMRVDKSEHERNIVYLNKAFKK